MRIHPILGLSQLVRKVPCLMEWINKEELIRNWVAANNLMMVDGNEALKYKRRQLSMDRNFATISRQ
uniref:Uncharacterized protein n=1 Tax=Parastrongyloides trichosuri TaxID=131310 RepID=A0A0N5A0E9_PARTI